MKLYLDKSKLSQILKEYEKENPDFIIIDFGNGGNLNMFVLKFAIDGIDGQITFYFTSKGYTTIQCSGKNIKQEKDIVDYIISNNICYSSVDQMANVNNVINMSDNQYLDIISFLNNIATNVQTMDNRDTFISKYGDKLYIIKHVGKIQIQGKAGYLFSQFVSYLIAKGYINQDCVNNIYKQTFNIEHTLPTNEYIKMISNEMPKSYPILDDHLKIIMEPSIILITNGPNLPEYSAYIFPIYRMLEGFLRQLLNLKNIKYSDNTFNCFTFDKTTSRSFLNLKKNLNLQEITCLENLYNYLSNKRNPVFHTEKNLQLSKIIQDREIAKSHIYDTMKLIETNYNLFIS